MFRTHTTLTRVSPNPTPRNLHPYSTRKKRKPQSTVGEQLSIFAPVAPPPPPCPSKPILSRAPVPADVNLGNRYFLTIQHNDLAWTIPAQLTINEASAIERRLRRVDLSLKPVMAGKGKNRHVKRIRPIEEDLVLEIAEAVIERRWSIDTPEVEGGLAA